MSDYRMSNTSKFSVIEHVHFGAEVTRTSNDDRVSDGTQHESDTESDSDSDSESSCDDEENFGLHEQMKRISTSRNNLWKQSYHQPHTMKHVMNQN